MIRYLTPRQWPQFEIIQASLVAVLAQPGDELRKFAGIAQQRLTMI